MSRFTMIVMLVAGLLLLCVGVSGFVSDAEVSSIRLGSDFEDARYQTFNEHSVERAQQRTRREQIGMEAVAGVGLMIVGMIFAPAKRKPARKLLVAEKAVSSRPIVLLTPAEEIQNRYASNRRRPNANIHVQPLRAKNAA